MDSCEPVFQIALRNVSPAQASKNTLNFLRLAD
jgi:hypothetical protein